MSKLSNLLLLSSIKRYIASNILATSLLLYFADFSTEEEMVYAIFMGIIVSMIIVIQKFIKE